jgi:hypothetical protein
MIQISYLNIALHLYTLERHAHPGIAIFATGCAIVARVVHDPVPLFVGLLCCVHRI